MRFATSRADHHRQTDRQTHRLFSKITFFAFLNPKTLKSGKISNLNFCTITILLLEKNFSGRSNRVGAIFFFWVNFLGFLSFFLVSTSGHFGLDYGVYEVETKLAEKIWKYSKFKVRYKGKYPKEMFDFYQTLIVFWIYIKNKILKVWTKSVEENENSLKKTENFRSVIRGGTLRNCSIFTKS